MKPDSTNILRGMVERIEALSRDLDDAIGDVVNNVDDIETENYNYKERIEELEDENKELRDNIHYLEKELTELKNQ